MDTFLKAKYLDKEVVVLSLGIADNSFVACVLDEKAKQLQTVHTKYLDDVELIALQQTMELGGDIFETEDS